MKLDDEEFTLGEDETQVLHTTTTTLLHGTAVNGNKRLLQKLLQEDNVSRDEINRGDQFGRTPLVYSILGDRLDCAKLLILYGASVSMADVDGRTPLHWATYQGSHKCVKLLLSKGADWKAKDTKGRTPLHFAASHQSSKCLSVLLKKAAKGEVQVDEPDNDSMTALHWGASYGNTEHVKMLLKARASVKLLDLEKKTPLHWGTTNPNPSVVKQILEQTNEIINWQDIEGRTALHLAVARQNEVVVKTLLAVEQCNVSVQDNMDRTSLHWAAVLGNPRIVKLLLRRDADFSLVDGNGATSLHYAAQGDYAKTVEVLLSFRNVQDTPDNEGRTTLIWAAAKGASSALETMLNHHLDVHDTDSAGRTALHVAAFAGDIKCVEILLQHGASVNALDELNHTPLFRACEMGYADVVNVLKRNKAMLDLEDQDGRSPLHWAALNGHAHICLTLVTNGVQANRGDRIGCTPLHCAAYGGFVNCMSVLIDNGADVNKLDKEGISALHWSCSSGHVEAVKLLLRKGAFPNFRKLDGEMLTPLDYAILGDHQDVAQYMIEQGGLTINAIQDVAATTIQSCWRGYRVRKPFQKRKMLYMRHEQLKRDIKRRASAAKEEELRDKLQMIEASTSSAFQEFDGNRVAEEEGRSSSDISSRRQALCHTSDTDDGYFKLQLDLQLGHVRSDLHNTKEYEQSPNSSSSCRVFYDQSDEEDHLSTEEDHLSTILESSLNSQDAEGSVCSNGSGKELIRNVNAVRNDSKMGITTGKPSLPNIREEPNERPITENTENLKASIYEILLKESRTFDSNFSVPEESSLVPSNERNPASNTVVASHGSLANNVGVIPVDGCVTEAKREVVIFQNKSEPARKERGRRNLIRAKMEAATVIQRWYRRHLRERPTGDDTLVEGLLDQEELIRQVAALTIQLCWRKFLRNEYLRTERCPDILSIRNSENPRFRESNKRSTSTALKGMRSRNKVSVKGSQEDLASSTRSRSDSKASPSTSTFVRHRRTAMTSTHMTPLDMYGRVSMRRDTRSIAHRRGTVNKIRSSTAGRTSKSAWKDDGGSYGKRSNDSWKN